jgi:hypothetical protein
MNVEFVPDAVYIGTSYDMMIQKGGVHRIQGIAKNVL